MTDTNVTRRVLFTSRTYLPDAAIDNIDILRVSIASNARAGISAALLKARDQFYQLMEGPVDEMAACLDRIAVDQRHYAFEVLLDRVGPGALLHGCPMVFVQRPSALLDSAGVDVARMADLLARLPRGAAARVLTKDAAPKTGAASLSSDEVGAIRSPGPRTSS